MSLRAALLAAGALVATAPACAQTPDSAAAVGPAAPVRATAPCVVTRIVDGDTIECRPLGRVRLIGMDTPERNQGPFYERATAALAALLAVGDTVATEADVEATDRYDRALRYVWKGGVLLNWRLVRDGWAVLLTYPPNVQYVDWFVAAERAAREEQRGLWAVDGFRCRPVDHRARRC